MHFLKPEHALLAVIDIQENHYPYVLDTHAVLDRICRVVDMANILEVPIVWTEHYPRGFGETLSPLAERLEGLSPIAKTSFGCFGSPEFTAAVQGFGRSDIYLVGTETPICILQTALDALGENLRPVVIADCVTGRRAVDHEIAMERMTAAGVLMVTWEMLAYEWLRKAEHPKFKRILTLVKGASNHQQVGGGEGLSRWGGLNGSAD